MSEHRSPTEILIHVLEQFGKEEPDNVLVIWTSDEGMISYETNGSLPTSLGMLELLKSLILSSHFSEESLDEQQ